MNKSKQLLIATSLSCLVASAAAQTTTIIGGATGNGNFENTSTTGSEGNFNQTPDWGIFGGDWGDNATNDNLGSTSPINTGTRNAILKQGGSIWYSSMLNDTKLAINEGDQFQISFDWLDAFEWDDAKNEIQVYLYTTSAGAWGTNNEIATITSGTSSVDYTWESFTSETITAGALNDGENLFIKIQAIPGVDGGTTGYARFDNFQLIAIPEHNTSALIGGILALGAIMIRRRRYFFIHSRGI